MGTKAPAVPSDPSVDFIACTPGRFGILGHEDRATKVKFALWDHAFKTTEKNSKLLRDANNIDIDIHEEEINILRADEAESENLAGADSRRFYLRVIDASAASRQYVDVSWRTLDPTNKVVDQPTNDTITLTRVEGSVDPPVFVSRGLILSPFDDDRPPDVHTGLSPKHKDEVVRKRSVRSTHGLADYRIRQGVLRGFTEANYVSPSGAKAQAKAQIFAPEDLRTLRIHLMVLQRPSNDDHAHGVISTEASSTLWEDLRLLTLIYAQWGIEVESALPRAAPSGMVLGKEFAVAHVHGHPELNLDGITENLMADLAQSLPTRIPSSVRVVYAGKIKLNQSSKPDSLRGLAFTRTYSALKFSGDDRRMTACEGTVFLSASARNHHTLAHEVAHVLIDNPHGEGHFKRAAEPSTLQQHLLRASGGPLMPLYMGNRRIYPGVDGSGMDYLSPLERTPHTYLTRG